MAVAVTVTGAEEMVRAVREALETLPDGGGALRWSPYLKDVLAEALVTSGQRSTEYSPGSDPFSNLNRAYLFGIVPKVWMRPLIDVLDNVQSVVGMALTGARGSTDGVADRLKDGGMYMFLAEAMRRQYEEHPELIANAIDVHIRRK